MEDDVDTGAPAEILADAIAEIAGHIAAATYRLLRLIAEFDRRGAWADWGCRSCAHWLNWQIGLDPRTAREHVRVARRLTALPVVAEAFAAGSLSFSKVRAICRVATPATEAQLVTLARNGTAAHLERITGAYRRCVTASAEQAERQHERRRFDCFVEDDGSYMFSIRVPAEVGATLREAVDAAMRPGQEPYAERAADAFTDLVTGKGRPLVVLHVDPSVGDDDTLCHVEGGGPLSAATARRLACDATRVDVTEDGGNVLDVGRARRTIPVALRRALHVRDGGCRFPGCPSRRFTDGHHITHWADGGRTSLSNLVLLCRHHHRLVHEGGWRIHTDGGGLAFSDPRGRSIETVPRRLHGRAKVIRHPKIDPDTIRCGWGGERLDLGMAIDGLLWADRRLQQQRE